MEEVLNKPDICAVILCAGSGTRTGLNYNKILHFSGKKTIVETALDAFMLSRVNRIVLVCADCDREAISLIAAQYKNVTLAIGGQTRTESARNGLKAAGQCDIVCIHDGARPYILPQTIDKSIDSALKYGSGVVAVPCTDTVKEVKDGLAVKTLDRNVLYNIQTPQTFRFNEISAAYQKADGVFSDDSAVYENAGFKAHIVSGEYSNIKVTTPEDLFRLPGSSLRIGAGFDVHQLVERRALILGGVRIKHYKGLLGHSDADVLTHAVMDALLSAANLPDIGVLFPDTDDKYSGADSIGLLKEVGLKIKDKGYTIGNISAVIMAQKPKLAPHIPAMQKNIADALGISPALVTVSATTTEKLGIAGEEKGMASSASCLISV